MKFLAICIFALIATSLAGQSKRKKRGIFGSHGYHVPPVAPALEVAQPIQSIHTHLIEKVFKPYVVHQDHVVYKHIDQPRLVPQPFEVIEHIAQPFAVPIERTILRQVSVPYPVVIHKEIVKHYPVDVLVPQPYEVIRHVPIVAQSEQPEPVWAETEPHAPQIYDGPVPHW